MNMINSKSVLFCLGIFKFFTIIVSIFFSLGSSANEEIITFQQIETFVSNKNIPEIHEDSESKAITITVAGNEYEPARILLKSKVHFGETTAFVSELSNKEGAKLPNNSIVLRNVKRWQQLVPHAYKIKNGPQYHEVDELLVFNSQENLSGNWDDGRYFPPSPSDQFKTVIEADSVIQLWITARVEKNQAAGRYEGTINLIGHSSTTTLPITIEVLPFNLPEPDKYFSIFYRGSLAKNKRNVSVKALRHQLIDIKQHGFNSLVVYESDPKHMEIFFKTVAEVGFPGAIILALNSKAHDDPSFIQFTSKILRQYGLNNIYFAGIDEPNGNKRLKMQLDFSKKYSLDKKIFTSLTVDTDDQLQRAGINLDWVNYPVNSNPSKIRKKSLSADRVVTSYWQLYLEDAPRNRYYAGVFLLKNNLDGVLPYAYQAFHSIDPYTSDERRLKGRKIRENRLYKAFNVAYPTTAEPIPTIQWESMREGIDDYRYVQYMLDKSDNKEELEKEMQKRLMTINYDGKWRPFKPDSLFDASKLSEFRTWVVGQILKVN